MRTVAERPAKKLEGGMLADLEALTPPLVMAVAFLIGVGMFLRRQMGPRRHPVDECAEADNAGGSGNADPADPAQGSSAEEHKV
jgi:hypothetical protein